MVLSTEESHSFQAYSELAGAVAATFKKTEAFVTTFDTEFTSDSPFFLEMDDLMEELSTLQEDFHRLPARQQTLELKEKLAETEKLIQNCRALKPRTGSLFIHLFFGKVNCVVYSQEQRHQLKDDYVRFRKNMTWIYIVFPMLLYSLPRWLWVNDTIYHIWLLFYYVSHALRENFLRVNGSQIRRWWILHHYLSIVLTTILLTFPMGDDYQSIRHSLLVYAIIQGCVQVLSNRYQEKRLYKTRALGTSSTMDVPDTDTVTMRSTGQDWGGLLTVVPFLFIVQGLQLFGAISLLQLATRGSHPWQVAGLGMFFLFIAIGNLTTTIRTIVARKKQKLKAK